MLPSRCSSAASCSESSPRAHADRDGTLYKARTGAARLAMKIGCPIFPVGIVGTDLIQPCDAKVPKLRKECTITIGRAIRPERYAEFAVPNTTLGGR